MVASEQGWLAYTPDGRHTLDGQIGGAFWFAIGLCRFAPTELDSLVPETALTRVDLEDPLA